MFRKKNKYKNIKTVINRVEFDSMKEAKRYQYLKLLERSGEIRELVLQPKFILQEGFIYAGKKERAITYTADFEYVTKSGALIIEDVKGMKTDIYKMKRKMLLYLYRNAPNWEFHEV